MEISKSTPYVRYRENISSTLHKGTIHIESEYLDRERKTTIESIEGQTWQNMVNGENKDEDILPKLGLKIEGNEDVLDSEEQHMPIDTIIGDVEPVANEDGTYTYEISTMEGSYAKTLDGENNFSLTSDGLAGDMYIKYNAQGEEVNGNIVMNNWQSSYTIENSNNGEIKSAILSGQTLNYLLPYKSFSCDNPQGYDGEESNIVRTVYDNHVHYSLTLHSGLGTSISFNHAPNKQTTIYAGKTYTLYIPNYTHQNVKNKRLLMRDNNHDYNYTSIKQNSEYFVFTAIEDFDFLGLYQYFDFDSSYLEKTVECNVSKHAVIVEGDYFNQPLPLLEQGLNSCKMPVLTTVGKNLIGECINPMEQYKKYKSHLKPETRYTLNYKNSNGSVTRAGEVYLLNGETNSGITSFGYNNSMHFTTPTNVDDTTLLCIDSWDNELSVLLVEGEEVLNIDLEKILKEPYKSNTLTTPSDVTLRKVGDVQDELDLETGVLTQRVGEIVLDGSDDENWWYAGESDAIVRCNIKINIKWQTQLLSANIPVGNRNLGTVPYQFEGIANHFEDFVYLYIKKERIENFSDDLQDHEKTYRVKDWLLKNPITVQYQLAEPIIGQVDLTIKDQDDKIIQSLHTHPSTTHINLSSDGLIPSAEMNYTMYGNIGETTGEQITDGTDSKLIEGKIYGDTLLNVLPSPSLKNSMDYNTSMQKLNNGYDNVNAADGEFKSAILTGQTLVNLATTTNFSITTSGSIAPLRYRYTLPTGTYTVMADITLSSDGSCVLGFYEGYGQSRVTTKIFTSSGKYIWTENITNGNIKSYGFYVTNNLTTDVTYTLNNLVILSGDHIQENIPYFEGMQSVKMPSVTTCGKNLFNKEAFYNDWKSKVESYVYKEIVDNEEVLKVNNSHHLYTDDLGFRINVKKGVPLTLRMECKKAGTHTTNSVFIIRYDDKKYLDFPICDSDEWVTETTTFVPTRDYITFCSGYNYDDYYYVKNIQLEEGSVATSYEPHKSNTLTLNEPIELRAVGDVRDELDCLTGKLTQRIGEIVLDGSQTLQPHSIDQGDTLMIKISDPSISFKQNSNLQESWNFSDMICDKELIAETAKWNASEWNEGYNIALISSAQTTYDINSFVLAIRKSYFNVQSIDGFKTWLTQNPLTIQYKLAKESVKTVDLTITNQDNQPQTTLHSIANGYISTSSQGSLPKVDYEVPTSNSYYLDTMVKTNTQYTTKSSSDCNATIDGTIYPLSVNGTFTTPSTITDKLMVLDAQVDDLMFIEGDLTGRELDYFTGLQSVDMPILTTSNEDGTKTNILTANEDVTLRGIGDVKDELDLVNECVVRRIGLREYQDGDLTNNSVITDTTNTVYELATPTTEPVRIVPQNAKQSTVSLTLQSPLQKVGNVSDQLRWNPYKGHYVRYNYIQDGVANSTYTFEDLKDMNERKFVNLYNQRTYIDTDHTVQVISHGLSRYCLAEQGKQYQVRWDWVEQPSVDTIKVDLCGNVKEIPSSDNSVVIDVEKFTHQFVQIQGLGLTGKITNLMVIETIDGEIPDVDFFSGIQCIGNTVNIDGNTKVQIDMEQTNGNLIDEEFYVFNNGNALIFSDSSRLNIKPNKSYTYKIYKNKNDYAYTAYAQFFDKNNNQTRILNCGAVNNEINITELYSNYNETMIRLYTSNIKNDGSIHTHYPFELCYADMAKDGIRPRYYDKESIILPMKLCRVGNIYDNLYYDDLKGYYRIQQSIGHKYFTGETTEVWTMETTDGYRTIKFTCTSANIDQVAYGETICNQWKHLSTINDDIEGFIIYNGNFVLRVDKDRLTDKTVDGFKTLLASNPIHLFYQLKTPQMINLTEYPNRIEFNTYRDEIFTFFKGINPTKFTLSVPMDKTYRYEIEEEGQGLANRVTVNNETISAENMVAVKEVRGQGIANIIEDVNNIVITPRPNHGAVATSHTLNNTKPATIRVHGFEASGETTVANYNVTDKAYQLKVMSSNGDNSLSDYYVLNVPYKLETYADGTKDMVYYDEEYKQWHFKGSSVKEYTVASNGTLSETIEIFRGLAPRSGMIAEFKLMFTSGTTAARMYYSLDGITYGYTQLRGMSDGNYLYVGIFNTGGTKIDIAYKTDPNAEYTNFVPLSTQVPECFMINQITNCIFCELTLDKQYIYSEMNTPIELDTYEGTTKVFMDGNTTDTNIIIRNDATTKIVNTYTDTEYTVYWKYVDGLGNLRITLGGTSVEVDGKQEYATLKTQLNAPQELLYVGGYNLSIKDLMVVKGAKIDDLPYFEGSRQVGTLVLDEEGNKSYKITLVQGGSVLEQRDEDAIAFKDDNKHNVVVHKIVGVCPTKVD